MSGLGTYFKFNYCSGLKAQWTFEPVSWLFWVGPQRHVAPWLCSSARAAVTSATDGVVFLPGPEAGHLQPGVGRLARFFSAGSETASPVPSVHSCVLISSYKDTSPVGSGPMTRVTPFNSITSVKTLLQESHTLRVWGFQLQHVNF